jgi:hypothetical protein
VILDGPGCTSRHASGDNDQAQPTSLIQAIQSYTPHSRSPVQPRLEVYLDTGVSTRPSQWTTGSEIDGIQTPCFMPQESPLFDTLHVLDSSEHNLHVAKPTNPLTLDALQAHGEYPRSHTPDETDCDYDVSGVSCHTSDLWPLQSLEEAKLLRYFVTDLSIWVSWNIDLCLRLLVTITK